MMLCEVKPGDTRRIRKISGDEKVRKFLFTLGCYEGEEITLISIIGRNYIISLKGSRYAIDKNLSRDIELI